MHLLTDGAVLTQQRGSVSACIGFALDSTFYNIGNTVYFNDAYPTLGEQAIGLAFSMFTADLANGLTAKANGLSFWNGDPGMPSVPSMSAISGNVPKPNVKPSQMPKANVGDLVDDGLPKQGPIRVIPKSEVPLRSFTKSNFRTNLSRLTGTTPANSHAHHVFPQKYGTIFSSKGININNPSYGAWWNATNHLENARAYNIRWAEFLSTNPNRTQILNFGRQLMNEYSIFVSF